MKKFVSLLLAITISLSMTACQNIDSSDMAYVSREFTTQSENTSTRDDSADSITSQSTNTEQSTDSSDTSSNGTTSERQNSTDTSPEITPNSPKPDTDFYDEVNDNSSDSTSGSTTGSTTGSTSGSTSGSTTGSTTTTKPSTTKPPATDPSNPTPAPSEPSNPVTPNKYNALNFKEQKGVWITFLEMNTLLRGKTEAQFRTAIANYYQNIKNLGLNTVYVHAVAFSDAIYPSDYYDTSYLFTGTVGAKLPFDALQIAVEEGHNKGLSIHAWMNPFRAGSLSSNPEKMGDNYLVKKWVSDPKKYPEYVSKDSRDGVYWLNPGVPQVRKLIVDAAKEIVSNYDVDGIHIDDYFYTSAQNQGGKDYSFDEKTHSQYGANMSRKDFRMDSTNKFMKSMYTEIKKVNNTVEFGVSPSGNISNNTGYLNADVKTWCSTAGYIDYIVPQVYYGYDESLPYDKAIKQWQNIMKRSDIKLVMGLGVYKISPTSSFSSWKSGNILANQLKDAKKLSSYSGFALYRYQNVFSPGSSEKALIEKEIKALKESMK